MQNPTLLTRLLILLMVVPIHSFGQTFDWVRTFDGGSNTISGAAFDIVVDDASYVYTTGTFAGTVDFDPGAGIQTITSTGVNDLFISKHDNFGNLIWIRTFGGSGKDEGTSIALDNDGNLYVSGTFSDTVTFGSAGDFYSMGFMDLFVLKMDTAGVLNWVKHAGGPFGEGINGMDLDSNNMIYSTGYFEDAIDFDPGPATATVISAGQYDIFLWKLDSSGSLIQVIQMGDDKSQLGEGIVIGNNNEVVISGQFYGTTDFDPGSGINLVTSNGQNDIFILNLDTAFNFNWVQTFGTNYNEEIGYDLTSDHSGNILVTGCYSGTIDFDSGPGSAILTITGSERAFILKLDASGGFIWARDLGGIGSTEGHGITTDSVGNVYTTGNYFGNDDFDPGPGTVIFPPTGSGDCFISKLDSNGIFVYAGAIAGPFSQWGRSIVIGPDESIYTVGLSSDTVDFDPGAAIFQVGNSGLASAGFIHKMLQFPTAIEEYHNNNEIQIFPNPATTFLEIKSDFRNPIETICIIDMLGETKIQNTKTYYNTIDINALPSGVYLLQIKTTRGLFTKRIVKI